MDDEDERRDEDPRFDYVLQYILKTNKLKMEVWHKLKDTNAHKVTTTNLAV